MVAEGSMSKVKLVVNQLADGRVQCNMVTKVNSKTIRRFDYQGRAHIAIPSFTLPANVVMNGVLYPASEIDAHYKGLEGTPAPLGHPAVNGEFISARSAEGLNQGWVGAWNRNVRKSGDRVSIEKWIDVEVANRTEKGRELLARIDALEAGEDVKPIHTSVAMFMATEKADNQAEYEGIAHILEMDHDAILLDEEGAATPEQGVGMMVNTATARSLVANSGVLSDSSFRSRERRLEDAARAAFLIEGTEDWVFIADFDDSQAIVVRNSEARVYGYTVTDGVPTFDGEGTVVERQESWVRRLPGVNQLLDFFKPTRAVPEVNPEEENMTPEEKAALIQEVGVAVNKIVADALAPLAATITGVQANQAAMQASQTALQESLSANSRQVEEDMRKVVAKKHGEIIANSLKGEDLSKVFKECGEAPTLLSGNHSTQAPTGLGVPSAKDHLRA